MCVFAFSLFRLCINRQSKEFDSAVIKFLSEIKRFQDRVWAKNPVKVCCILTDTRIVYCSI